VSGSNRAQADTRHPTPDTRSAPTVLIAGGGTGGHLIPALVIAEAIQKRHPDWRVILAGAKRGLEARLLPERQFAYHLLPSEPLYRRQWWKNLRWPLLGVKLLREVQRLIDTVDPKVVIGTGGYASGPVVWLAARRGIPTAVLEINAYPGLAVRALSRKVNEIWLGSPEARSLLRPGRHTRIVDTGTPIAPPDPSIRPAAEVRFGLERSRDAETPSRRDVERAAETPSRRDVERAAETPSRRDVERAAETPSRSNAKKPVLLVVGGSQGALPINRAVGAWVESGAAQTIQVLWVTGRGSYSDFKRYHHPPEIQVFDFLDPIAPAYAVADLAMARAGMMTIAELSAWGIPSLLVPLPTAAADHQTANARAMEAAGASRTIPQTELDADRINREVTELLRQPELLDRMRAAARKRARPDALESILTRFGILSG
jgi:UDP-N-acetylglucosamine--N-acetylmuramyl-(pentapeptide) pyrophosphoryl-undecaprenol N-acetylglucosamine transferase